MSVVIEEPQPRAVSQTIVNDFNINVATANGSGSQTSNNMLIRSLYKMGIPVTGKNLFPSNIQGLPTWYNIRLSKDGFLARRERVEIMICMNGATVAEDMESVVDGGIILYDDSLPIANHRKDVQYFPMPVRELVKGANLPFNLQKYVANMVYVGVVCLPARNRDGRDQGRPRVELRRQDQADRAELGAWSAAPTTGRKANLVNDQPYRVERMTGFNEGTILVDGNTAAGIGALFAGMTFSAWYPITPSTSLVEAMNTYAAQLRRDPETGKATYAIVQAEDELAASGMIMGAGWAGARAMTATSGPGISLMSEFVGYGYFAEIPAVIWDIQRMGPSTGLPTRTSQGDILAAYYLSHGDGKHPILFPADPNECFEMAGDGLRPGRTPADAGLCAERPGHRHELVDHQGIPVPREAARPRQGAVAPKSWPSSRMSTTASVGAATWMWTATASPIARCPARATPQAAYFTRGTGHNEYAIYSERSDVWEHGLQRLALKWETARHIVPAPIVDEVPEAEIGIISLGSNDAAIAEARARLAKAGVKTSYLRAARPADQ